MGIESMPPDAVPWFYAGIVLTIASLTNLIIAIGGERKARKAALLKIIELSSNGHRRRKKKSS